MKRCIFSKVVFFALVLSALFIFMGQVAFGGESNNGCLVYDLPSSAEIDKISYYMDSYKGNQRLHMEIGLKNTTKEMKRYRVHIYLPQGVAGGGLYPRKEKGISPGDVHTRTFPMYYSELPASFEISVQELNE